MGVTDRDSSGAKRGSHGGFSSSRPEAWRGVSEALTRAGLAQRGHPQTCWFPDWTLRHQWWGLTRCRPRGGDHVPDAVCTWQSPPHAPGGRQRRSQAGLLRGGRLSTAALTPQGANGHGAPGPPETPETEVRLSLGIRSSRLKFQVQLLKFASM